MYVGHGTERPCSLHEERKLPAHLAVHEISEPEADRQIMAELWNLVQQRTADDLDEIEQQVVVDDELPTAVRVVDLFSTRLSSALTMGNVMVFPLSAHVPRIVPVMPKRVRRQLLGFNADHALFYAALIWLIRRGLGVWRLNDAVGDGA
jgi:hypothetical protein